MGLFCANIHVRTSDSEAVHRALAEIVDDPLVLDAEGEWISVYAPGLLEQEPAGLESLASTISSRLAVRAVSFWVYDSDIARYWLHDQGQLCDRFDSWPGYFDDEPAEPVGGDPDTLLGFSGPGATVADVRRILHSGSVFADDIVSGVAALVGINPERAVSGYRDVGSASERGRSSALPEPDWSSALGTAEPATTHDPDAVALVHAAATGDEKALVDLLAEDIAVDVSAPTPLPGGESLTGLGLGFPGSVPQVVMTPLMAAVANRQSRATSLLLDAGADPNQYDELFGTPLHAAAGAGASEALDLLLQHGGDPTRRDSRGQTPLLALEHGRRSIEVLMQTRAGLEAIGLEVPEMFDQLETAILPTEGWDACEELLRARGGDA